MTIDKKFDDTVYVLGSQDAGRMDAAGLRMNGWNYELVGVYFFWDEYNNPCALLKEVVRKFGEARIYGLPEHERGPGLVCKFSADQMPKVLSPESRGYKKLRMDLLEMRASSPKPYLSLQFEKDFNSWMPTLVPELASLDSNYQADSEEEQRKYG